METRKIYKVEDLTSQKILIVGDGYRAKNSELSNDGLPFARGANINQGFLFDGAECLDKSNLHQAGDKISRVGDVVFTSKGTVGRFAFVRENTKQFVYSPQLCYWRVLDQNLIDPRYLYFWMHGREFFEQYNGVKNQTDMADYVSLNNQRRFHITLPPIEEQKAIAKILSSLDDKIELNRQMNATLEAMARALFKAWFVDFEPVRANSENRPSESASPEIAKLFPSEFENGIPKGWRFETIDFLTSLIIDHRGKTPKKLGSDWSETGIPAISAKNIKSGRFVNKASINYLDENLYKIWMREKLQAGDVLMTSEAPLGELLYFADEKPLCLSQRVFALRANEKICLPSYFYFQLNSSQVQEEILGRATGTTVVGIRQSELRKVKVLLPSIEVQTKADRVFEENLKKISANQNEIDLLAEIRDLLLPRLISGKIRVSAAENEAAQSV